MYGNLGEKLQVERENVKKKGRKRNDKKMKGN
jgi:hypothetical protein